VRENAIYALISTLVRTLIAIYEAAHAVVAWATGRKIVRVTILPDGCSPAHTQYEPLPRSMRLEEPRNRSLAERECMLGLAGIIAERRVLGRGWRPNPSDTDVVLAGLMNRMAARVSVLLDLYWSRVQTLASALLERGEPAGREVQVLLAPGLPHF
jgi:hypothetical protein